MSGKIVLFGGTFDPLHNGHLIAARSVAETLPIDAITLVPAAVPPHKSFALAEGGHRKAMLELIAQSDDLFDVCDVELRRHGKSYTIDTIRYVQDLNPGADIAIIIGADMLGDLPLWYKWDDLVGMVEFIVAARPGEENSLSQSLEKLKSGLNPDQLSLLRISAVNTPLIDISSTDIRNRCKGQLSIRYLVPRCVEQYINDHGLYR